MQLFHPISSSILWRRLDVPGHDAARLRQTEGGAELQGMAVFHDEVGPTALQYMVRCDPTWQTTEATVEGWSNDRSVELRILRLSGGRWRLNGAPAPQVTGCVDVDLSFTPATNLLPLRRLNLAVGESAEVRSAWLEWPAAVLAPLPQRYARRSVAEYDYEADLPGNTKFVAVLRVGPGGWVLEYGELWQAEAVSQRNKSRVRT